MPKFFVPKEQIEEKEVTLLGADAHHISYSLRMAVGDALSVMDGTGALLDCRIIQMDGERVRAEILSRDVANTESPVAIHLYQAYPKSDKLEFIIQKAVELGVSTVTPFESERCIKRPKAEKVEKQTERQQRIATEAAKQCGRATLPRIHAPISFSAMLEEAARASLVLFCYEGEGTCSVKEICLRHPMPDSVAVIVGCEGGFSLAEAEAARAAGFCMTGLGKRILRCETAPLYALCALSYAYELEG